MSALAKGLGDLIRENSGGKVSSKKIWGHISFILVGMTYVMDGYDFYTINQHLFDSLLIAACYLIGLRTLANMFVRGPKNEEKPKTDEVK